MPRAYLPKEVREQFVDEVVNIVRNAKSKQDVALDIMELLDGLYPHAGLPAFAVVPIETADSQAQRISDGENFYSEAPPFDCNIAAGALMHVLRKRLEKEPPPYTPKPVPQQPAPKMPSKLEKAFESYDPSALGTSYPGTGWPPDIKTQQHPPTQQLVVQEFEASFALDSSWNPMLTPKTTHYSSQQFSMRHTFPEQMFKGIAASTAADHYMQDAVHKIAQELWKAGMFQVREVPKTDPSLTPYDSHYTRTYEVSMFFLLPPQPFPKPY